MDTKSKKFNNKITRYISNAIFIVVGTATLGIGMLLFTSYDTMSMWTMGDNQWISTYPELWISFLTCLAVTIAALVTSICLTKAYDNESKVKLNWFDKIFPEVQIISGGAVATSIMGAIYLSIDCVNRSSYMEHLILTYGAKEQFEEYTSIEYYFDYIGMPYKVMEPYWLEVFFAIVISLGVFFTSLMVVLSIVKKIKARCFFRSTIAGRIICYVKHYADKSEKLLLKVMIVLIVGCLLSATWIGTVVVLVLIVIFIPKIISRYKEIEEGVKQVKAGNLDYKIPVDDTAEDELSRMARNINDISEATSIAVQNELKNQRMKTELISNVSHDLKTPLTSMISYVDLIKREGLDSENAPGYLDIVEEKTLRLKKLTEDLFEAAKASSGAIPVNMEKIEMTSIVNQALAETHGALEEQNLQVFFSPKAEINFVMADGQLLWRVIENLLVNVSKYALPGSRVYMDITEQGENRILLEVKNMSKDALNISEDELMERFKRGDESRNTEGSGLGLAIAKDLTAIMGGDFGITIDGDLFKASVSLIKAL